MEGVEGAGGTDGWEKNDNENDNEKEKETKRARRRSAVVGREKKEEERRGWTGKVKRGGAKWATVAYPFKGKEEEGQLSVAKGDVVRVLSSSSPWWLVERVASARASGEVVRGKVPYNYVCIEPIGFDPYGASKGVEEEEEEGRIGEDVGLSVVLPSEEPGQEGEGGVVVKAKRVYRHGRGEGVGSTEEESVSPELAAAYAQINLLQQQLLVTQQESIAKSKLIHALTRALAENAAQVKAVTKELEHCRLQAERHEQHCLSGACQLSSLAATKAAIRTCLRR